MGIQKFAGESFEIHIPICVIGAGACGLSAGISAAQNGGKVAIIERDKTPAGSTAMTIGLICAAGTNEQERLGITDDAESLFQDIMAATGGDTDPMIARLIADESDPTMLPILSNRTPQLWK